MDAQSKLAKLKSLKVNEIPNKRVYREQNGVADYMATFGHSQILAVRFMMFLLLMLCLDVDLKFPQIQQKENKN